MRKIIFLFAFTIVALKTEGQVLISLLFGDKLNSPGVEFGLEGGINYSTITGMDSHQFESAFNLGFYFDIRLHSEWNLYTGVLVRSKQGLKNLSSDDLSFLGTTIYNQSGKYKQILNTFLVPTLLKYKMKNHFYLEAGPQFGLTSKAWIQFESDENGLDATIKDDNIDDINRIEAGVLAGFGYKLMKGQGITIGLKFYQGLTNVYKHRTGTMNQGAYLKMNIPIGATKKIPANNTAE